MYKRQETKEVSQAEASEEAEEAAGETQCAKRSVFPKELVESLNSVVI